MTAHLDMDLDGEGKQFGFVHIASATAEGRSVEVSTPIVSIANGAGPVVVMTAGVHGDEYEGQIALSELARMLRPQDIRGRVTILPTLNAPACRAGQRRSPIDGKNLNRAFPGSGDGTFTSQLALFVERTLFARCDYAVDFHGGGAILEFLPSTLFVVTGDAAEDRKRWNLACAFGAPHCLLFGSRTMGVDVAIDAAMLRMNVVGISGEYAGAATVTKAALDLCRSGSRRLLSHVGVAPDLCRHDLLEPVLVDVRPNECTVVSDCAGVLELLVELGDFVTVGAAVARLHRPDMPQREPVTIYAAIEGLVVARRAPALCASGDWLLIIGRRVAEIAPGPDAS